MMSLPMERIDVARVQTKVHEVRESMGKESPSAIYGRNCFHDFEVAITIVVLWEIQKIGWPIVINCDIDAWHLVETNIVISYSENQRHQVPNSRGQRAIQFEIVVPGICTSWHIIVISNIPTNKEHVGFKRGHDFSEDNGRPGISRVSSIDHPDRHLWIVTQSLVDGIGPELIIVKDSDEVFSGGFQTHNESRVDIPLVVPVQPVVLVGLGLHRVLLRTVIRVDLLVVDCDVIHSNVGMQVDEDRSDGVLW